MIDHGKRHAGAGEQARHAEALQPERPHHVAHEEHELGEPARRRRSVGRAHDVGRLRRPLGGGRAQGIDGAGLDAAVGVDDDDDVGLVRREVADAAGDGEALAAMALVRALEHVGAGGARHRRRSRRCSCRRRRRADRRRAAAARSSPAWPRCRPPRRAPAPAPPRAASDPRRPRAAAPAATPPAPRRRTRASAAQPARRRRRPRASTPRWYYRPIRARCPSWRRVLRRRRVVAERAVFGLPCGIAPAGVGNGGFGPIGGLALFPDAATPEGATAAPLGAAVAPDAAAPLGATGTPEAVAPLGAVTAVPLAGATGTAFFFSSHPPAPSPAPGSSALASSPASTSFLFARQPRAPGDPSHAFQTLPRNFCSRFSITV